MKSKGTYVRTELHPDNESAVVADFQAHKGDYPAKDFLLLCAQVCDAAIEGSNTFITLGATRNREALLLTLNQDGFKAYASGATLMEVLSKVKELL